MKIFEKINDLTRYLSSLSQGNSSTIGFVPTMGALHKGHLTLVEKAKSENTVVVCSIFVNPSQFNDKKDLDNYPRTIANDIKMLEKVKCDILFAPPVSEIYPEKQQKEADLTVFDFGILDKVMEGKFRPGHFKGVALVVSKLFEIVRPSKAYFGQKDFQQLTIIKKLTEQLNFPVDIIDCPIVREADGLAMSSRNVNLSAEERKNAGLIAQTLFKIKEMSGVYSVNEIKLWVENEIGSNSLMRMEYFELADSQTLLPIDEWKNPGQNVALIAVFLGSVRLIDNIIL